MFTQYRESYAHCTFDLTDDGILFMQCHTNGDSLVWDRKAHDEMSDAFADIAGDRDVKVLIHTGTGMNYAANRDRMPHGDATETPGYDTSNQRNWYTRQLIRNVLDVEVPMISAVNGPCDTHSEVPLMGDIVLASEDAYFQVHDSSHFLGGQMPNEGHHVIWSFRAGNARARHFLLTGKRLGAQEAREWGVVNEVLPKDRLLDRAWELARELVKRPPLILRYSRQQYTKPMKRAFLDASDTG
jgi:enoyl-CoA hydratase/carnithine racemase